MNRLHPIAMLCLSLLLTTCIPAQTPAPTNAPTDCLPSSIPLQAQVTHIIDGDTIDVLIDGREHRVRYIGIDARETNHPETGQEYFGPEATARNEQLVSGQIVTLIKDISETDQYNRLLRYVLVGDTFVNYELVAQGYANAVTFPPDVACADTFRQAEHRSILKCLPCSDSTVQYLARLVIADIEASRRFRRVDCLKVLRATIRNADEFSRFEPNTVRLLFQIYRNLIFDVAEGGKWATSVLIKDQLLTIDEIEWLIENCKRSVHPLNRLLLYPEYHSSIAAWAEKAYKSGEFLDREAEVIALVIQDDIPPYVDRSDADLIIRAISRARIPNTVKEILFKRVAHKENFGILLDLALRLEMPSLIRYMIVETNEEKVT